MISMSEKLDIGIAKLPYSGSRGGSETSKGPEIMEQGGLLEILERMGCTVADSQTTVFTAEEETHYGTRHRFGLASKHLTDIEQ